MNKFEDINGRFMSLGTGITQSNKFEDRWWTLLLFLSPIAGCAGANQAQWCGTLHRTVEKLK
jgi:hypothetical protein